MKFCFRFAFLCLVVSGCSPQYSPPVMTQPFSVVASTPDYSESASWAALPDIRDSSDCLPLLYKKQNTQCVEAADVFFIHPTSYLKNTTLNMGWNATIDDPEINIATDKGSIKNQASIFNGAGRVFAPRYRQAFIYSYYETGRPNGSRALDLAYEDVRAAFLYYLEHYNMNRPFIIASHSQGTTHAIRLLKEFIDGKPLSQKMIAAYLVGMDVYDSLFTVLTPCRDGDETNCYVTWRTYAVDYYPPGYKKPERLAVCTNPLTWKTDEEYASREMNKGGVLWNFDKVIPNISDAQIGEGVLRIHKPRFRGKVFFNLKNYHIVDYNLFYCNIRENAINRVTKYYSKQAGR